MVQSLCDVSFGIIWLFITYKAFAYIRGKKRRQHVWGEFRSSDVVAGFRNWKQ